MNQFEENRSEVRLKHLNELLFIGPIRYCQIFL